MLFLVDECTGLAVSHWLVSKNWWAETANGAGLSVTLTDRYKKTPHQVINPDGVFDLLSLRGIIRSSLRRSQRRWRRPGRLV